MIAQSWTAVLLGVAVVGSGAGIGAVVARRLALPTATRVAMIGAGGLAVVGLVTLVVGHVGLLGPWLPYGLAVIGVVVGLAARVELVATMASAWRAILRQFRRYPIPLAAVALCLVIAFVTCFAPPSRRDEIEYHWPAPLDWAAQGVWTDSPYRHVDGFPFMEIVYTSAATQGSYVAAHLLHFGAFLTLGFAVAGVAASMGVRGTGVTAAAALAMPVVWDSAYAAYNDTPVATFAMLAVAVVLAAPRRSLSAVLVAGLLIAVATSIKPTGIVSVGVVGLIILMRFAFGATTRVSSPTHVGAADTAGSSVDPVRAPGSTPAGEPRPPLGRLAAQLGVLVAPGLLALAFWSIRQFVITGDLIDPRYVGERDPEAAARLPDAMQQLIAPLLPFVGGIIGSAEPWGGRTSLVVQLFLIPALIYVFVRRGSVLRRTMLMLVPAWAHWIVLGLVNVRTRFHVLSWAMMVVAVRIAVEDFADRHPRARIWLEIAWTLCILLGLADVSFEMIRHLQGIWA
ncbi:hypothetical protein [Agromyces sp. SYSU T00266]|uniref:hypothetical protein n=1 Tax=Agromyces zhanjiangensis TaxID=3158562 RepID=UPI0033973D35